MTAFVHWIITLSLLAVFPLIPQNRRATRTDYTPTGSDWAEWRGPHRDGTSGERGLPEKWSPTGENLLWKVPYGGRSAPIVMGDRVFLFNSSGSGATMQERLICFDADTGRVLWEHKSNVYSSDVPPRRIAWASPTGDQATGNVYTFGATAHLTALTRDGRLLWERSLTDEFGAWTTHGGRTVSPIIEGDLVIVSTVTDGWGDLGQRRHRYYAFDKRTGESVWINTPGGRPFDTTYSTPIVTTVDGMRLMISGGGDGAVHAMKVSTGEAVWSYAMSKRGINPSVVIDGTTAYVSHQEENIDTIEMGHLAAIDLRSKGEVTKDKVRWSVSNYQLGPSSPVLDGERYYHVDAGANLHAFDTRSGRMLWVKNLGTIQKASPVLADGKLYVGTENGKFFILKPGATGCEILDEDELEPGMKIESASDVGDDIIAANEQILAAVAVSRGRIYLASTKHLYCIGKREKPPALPMPAPVSNAAPAGAAVAHVQVVPADTVIRPGEAATFRVRLFDDRGRFIRAESGATWSHEGLKGSTRGNQFTPAADAGPQAGLLKAAVGNVTGAAAVRVIPAPPFTEDFESVAVGQAPAHWINTAGKYAVRELDGSKVLVKNPNPPAFKRTRSPIGPGNWSNYTVEADVRATEKRRQMGDAGVVAQRYELVLLGNTSKLELRSWQIEPTRTVNQPFSWKADTWYHLKLQVENLPNGQVRARGKAWARGEAEPAAWMIERVDPIGNRHGSPGIFADAPFEVFIDNVKVTPNR